MASIVKKIRTMTLRRLAFGIYARCYQYVHIVWKNLRFAVNSRGESPRVYFPYERQQLHNTYLGYLVAPPLRYAPIFNAQLINWVNWAPPTNHEYLTLSRPEPHWIRDVRVPLRPRPYVVEVEHVLALAGRISDWPYTLGKIDDVNRIIEQDRCRCVISATEGMTRHAKRYVRPDLWHKLDHAYLTFPTQPEYEIESGRPFTILTISSRFYDKGVPEAIKAYEILRGRHGEAVRMILVSQAVPPGFHLPDGVTHHTTPRMSDQFKRDIYQSSDVSLLPVYSDTGSCFTESYAYAVPVVTTRITHDDEWVKNGVTGFLVDPPFYSYSDDYAIRWKTWEDFQAACEVASKSGAFDGVVEQSVHYLEQMISGAVDLEAMRREARRFHAERFSPEARNPKLLAIYAKALSVN